MLVVSEGGEVCDCNGSSAAGRKGEGPLCPGGKSTNTVMTHEDFGEPGNLQSYAQGVGRLVERQALVHDFRLIRGSDSSELTALRAAARRPNGLQPDGPSVSVTWTLWIDNAGNLRRGSRTSCEVSRSIDMIRHLTLLVSDQPKSGRCAT